MAGLTASHNLDVNTETGYDVAASVNAIIAALTSTSSGGIFDLINLGALWVDTGGYIPGTDTGNILLKLYDGAGWRTLFTIARPAGTLTTGAGLTAAGLVKSVNT